VELPAAVYTYFTRILDLLGSPGPRENCQIQTPPTGYPPASIWDSAAHPLHPNADERPTLFPGLATQNWYQEHPPFNGARGVPVLRIR
jgi:hypothetical protein